jgi:hypothetical protein
MVQVRVAVRAGEARTAGSRTKLVGSVILAVRVWGPGGRVRVERSRVGSAGLGHVIAVCLQIAADTLTIGSQPGVRVVELQLELIPQGPTEVVGEGFATGVRARWDRPPPHDTQFPGGSRLGVDQACTILACLHRTAQLLATDRPLGIGRDPASPLARDQAGVTCRENQVATATQNWSLTWT